VPPPLPDLSAFAEKEELETTPPESPARPTPPGGGGSGGVAAAVAGGGGSGGGSGCGAGMVATRGEATGAKADSKRVLPEKARRELAKRLREATGASARLCEKALQAHADDMDRAAEWLLSQTDNKGETNGN